MNVWLFRKFMLDFKFISFYKFSGSPQTPELVVRFLKIQLRKRLREPMKKGSVVNSNKFNIL